MFRRKLGFKVAGALAGILAAGAVGFEAQAAVPATITQQGLLLDQNNDAVTGKQSFTFAIYDAATGGKTLWTETQSITLDGGYFSTQLGAVTPIPTEVFDGSTRYLGIKVGTDAEMSPRETVTSVPYAMVARDVNGDINPTSITVNGTKIIDATGHWVGPTTGLAGSIGATGPAGADGAKGATGAQGAQGPQGVQGIQGPTGPSGAKGDVGATGAVGPTGAAGPTGAVGPTGASGKDGSNGTNGTNGTNGANGATGPTGASGKDGANGINGINGTNGATGPMGPSGADGVAGPTGAIGVVGSFSAGGHVPVLVKGAWGLVTPTQKNAVKLNAGQRVFLSGSVELVAPSQSDAAVQVASCYDDLSGNGYVPFTDDATATTYSPGINGAQIVSISRSSTQAFPNGGSFRFGLCVQSIPGQATPVWSNAFTDVTKVTRTTFAKVYGMVTN